MKREGRIRGKGKDEDEKKRSEVGGRGERGIRRMAKSCGSRVGGREIRGGKIKRRTLAPSTILVGRGKSERKRREKEEINFGEERGEAVE